jgi:hypothetical protein
MHNRVIVAFAVAGVTAMVASAPGGFAQDVEQKCQPFDGGCVSVAPPRLNPSVAGPKSVPRTAEGHPDFTGVWAGPGFSHQVGPNDTDEPIVRGYDSKKMSPLTPIGEKLFFRALTGDMRIDHPIGLCLPYGFTAQILSPMAQQWIQAPNWLVIRHEFMNNFSRVIPLDGRPHRKDLDLTWGGDSIGRWEGDTLVIDTIGLKEWQLVGVHRNGSLWHSDALHVTERIRYIEPMIVSHEVTIDDPTYFTKPWSEEFHMVLHPTWNLLEYVCNENDRCAGGKCIEAEVQKTSP